VADKTVKKIIGEWSERYPWGAKAVAYIIALVIFPVVSVITAAVGLFYLSLGIIVSTASLIHPCKEFQWPHRAAIGLFVATIVIVIGVKVGYEVKRRG